MRCGWPFFPKAFLLVICIVGLPAVGQEDAARAGEFEQAIEPLFHQRCYMCHGPSQQMSGLRLDLKAEALKGGYSGAVIVPGDSSASNLMQRVSSGKEGYRMPPVGAPLAAKEIAALEAWIDAGAPWPDQAAAAKLSEEQKHSHWAFQPVERPEPPKVRNESWVRNPIDRFILSKLESEEVQPSPEAGKVTLIRRVSFDLLGLPPTPEQVDRFVADDRPEAYQELVGELLRSPHYGERQAIDWLDAARYADSDGYERDPLRPHAWRWRHWVINALNDDMPFDQFTVKQIAGDLLPEGTVEQRVATGFLRNGIKNREAGVKNEEKHFEETIDRINTIGTVWLGLTVGCAQCHDHKYDPLSQKEFYQMFAVFNNAVEHDVEAPLPNEIGPYLWAYPEYRAEREKMLRENGIYELQARWQAGIIEAMDNPGVNLDWDYFTTEWRSANDRSDWKMRADPNELTQIEKDEVTNWFVSRPGPVFNKDEEIKKRIENVREALADLEKDLPPPTRAYTVIERKPAAATHIALRGDWRAPGVEVEGAVPAVVRGGFEPKDKPVRLAFAEWLVSRDNPLTPRVTVNRMWQDLFGRGLVRTADDFGTQGDKPTHPELLDWLASEFVEGGWSRKHMLRLMVTSATYRQSSQGRPTLAERDPQNEWLSRQSRLRLAAELIRDNALSVSGLLDQRIGGKSMRPPQPEGVSDLSYSSQAWVADTGAERYRRGMYILFRRTSPYPMLINFDAPATLVASVKRLRSNTPLQALNLLNDPVFFEAAQTLALSIVGGKDDFNTKLDRMFQLCLSRSPEAAERDRIATYFGQQKRIFEDEGRAAAELAPYVPPGVDETELAAWTGLARGLMNLDEFVTRE